MIDFKKYLTNQSPDKKKYILMVSAILAVVILLVIFYINDNQKTDQLISETQQLEEETTSESDELKEYTGEVIVDICGAVKEEMVVTLPADSRIEDAIEAAGGLKDDADLSNINRAQILEDGQKIYIPYEGEEDDESQDTTSSTESGVDSDGIVNINTATAEELETLDGIGPVTAEKIIAWRTEYGSFQTVDDLMEVNGIGEKTFAQIKDKIKV